MSCRGKHIFRPGRSPPPQLPRVFPRRRTAERRRYQQGDPTVMEVLTTCGPLSPPSGGTWTCRRGTYRRKNFSAPGTFPAPGTSVRMKTVKGRRKAMRENRKLMVKEVLAVALAIVMLVVFQF